VKALMTSAAQAYAAENFTKAAQLLETAGELHPGNLAIGCNLGLTRYQQGRRDDALALLDECVASLREKDTRRRFAELDTALSTGDRASIVAPGSRPQVVRLNDAILRESDRDASSEDDDSDAPTAPAAGLCAQMKLLQPALTTNPALLFNLASCAESEGRGDDATKLLTEYGRLAPGADDIDDVQARLVVLKNLPRCRSRKAPRSGRSTRAPRSTWIAGSTTWRLRTTRRQTRRSRSSWRASAESRRCWRRRVRPMQRARTGSRWWPRRRARKAVSRRSCSSMDWTRREGQYDELVSAASQILRDLVGRSVLEAEPVGRIYAAYRLQLASSKIQFADLLLPIAPEASLLQAFTCAQMNDFHCVRASFDAQRSLTLPVSFYGAVFYKGVDPKKKSEQERTYAKLEFEKGTVRLAEISTVKPKKRTALLASPSAGEDRLGRLGVPDGMRAGGFQGFTVQARTIKRLENQNGMLYLEVDDKSLKHRKMLIEPLNFVLVVPPQGPGARRYMNNYINIAETYGGVAKAKLGKESTTTGEKLKMVYNVASIGLA
jgi:tetratricopeptide (TPR) repeat protein